MAIPQIHKIFIRNVDTKADVLEIINGVSINTKVLPKNWNIRFEATDVKSVKITVDGTSNIENNAPYCSSGDNIPTNLAPGTHTVIAIPCADVNGNQPATPKQISFNLIVVAPMPPAVPAIPLKIGKETLTVTDSNKIFGNQTISFNFNKNAYPVIHDNGNGNTFQSILFKGGNDNVLLIPKPGIRNGKLLNCEMIDGGSLFQGTNGVENYIIENCGSKFPIKNLGQFYLGGKEKPNKNITFKNCYSVGSINEHILRVHNTIGLICENCNFQNPSTASWANKKGACFNLRDGSDFKIIKCKGSGQVIVGPLADDNGGINDPASPEKTRKLNLRLKNVLFDTFELNGGYVIVEAGTENITFKNWTGNVTGGGGYFLSFQKQYGPREIPKNITIENCNMTGGKDPFAGKAQNLVLKNFTWNGKPVTSVWNGKPI